MEFSEEEVNEVLESLEPEYTVGQVTTRGGWGSAQSKTAFIAPSTSSAPMPTSAPTSTKRPAWPI